MPSYLNIRQAADYLGISPHTLYKLVERSEVPAAKVGGSWRLSPEALDEFLGGRQRRASRSPELLIVESDAEVRRDIASITMSRGARPQLAADPVEAVLLLSGEWKPDLVLYGVPEDAGAAHEFMRQVRATSPDCRVAAMVRPERLADLKDLMAYGWLIILPAPVERPELVNLIASL